jgi:hypothetical protein
VTLGDETARDESEPTADKGTERARRPSLRVPVWIAVVAVVALVAVIVAVRTAHKDIAEPFTKAGMACIQERSTDPFLWGCYRAQSEAPALGDPPETASFRWQEHDGRPVAFELNSHRDDHLDELGLAILGKDDIAKVKTAVAAADGSPYSKKELDLDWGHLVVVASFEHAVKISGVASKATPKEVPGPQLAFDRWAVADYFRTNGSYARTGWTCSMLDTESSRCYRDLSGETCTIATGADYGVNDIRCNTSNRYEDPPLGLVSEIFSLGGVTPVSEAVKSAIPERGQQVSVVVGWVIIVGQESIEVSSSEWRLD